VRKDTRELIEIELAFRLTALNHILQLGGRCPKNGVFEECSRRIRAVRVPELLQLSWIQVEICHAQWRAGLMPFTIGMAGWHERQLVGKISERGWRELINRCLAFAPNAILVEHQQVHGSVVTDFYPASGWRVDALRHYPVPLRAVSLD